MRFAWVLAGGMSCAALAYGLLSSGRLIVSGKEVQTDYIVQNGRTYVPLADVAKALNMAVQKIDGGYEMKPAGGANQVQGLNGKLGDQLNCGAFLFKVTDVVDGQAYDFEHSTHHEVPFRDSDKLVVVKFQVKNATTVIQSLDTIGGDLTALTDDAGHNFKSGNLDGTRAPDILPGAATEFALIYYVPKATTIGDIVYQMHSYSMKGGYKDYTFRVSLKKA
ncbi:MAG: hypothetical protein ACHQ50_10325 [Fimbriimonadales bacterium]